MNIKWLCIASSILLLLGIPAGWPYSYYILLRWVILLSSAAVAYSFYNLKLQGWALVFVAVAILFNPIMPFYLSKSEWVILDFIGACLFFIAEN